jgi:hypothetical protein
MFLSIIIVLVFSYIIYNINNMDEFGNNNIIYNYIYNISKHKDHYGHYDFIRSDLIHNGLSLNTKITN